uniref:DUF4378 domain-containing protein n=1 Tax=Fagus sylvatica TaxID=28930 RepID=A0A2N9H8X1_FAGSY
MEKFRQKRSKIASIADRSSGDRFFSTERAHREGNRQVQKQRNYPKLASDSSSCSSGSTDEEDLFTFELGWRASKQAAVPVTPMKKLLAEEMSRETESKRRSPSVIAKLMGLDGLPPQQPAHKQQKMSSESSVKRATSVEKAPKSGTFYDRRSSRRNSKEQQEFKDVFEVLETSKLESSSCLSQGMTNTKLTDAEMAFIQQKFMDAKRLSTDQKLQDSKEFHDALEVLDSNKDLLVKFLQQPDSLFTKHLHDLHGAPPQTHCGRIAAMKLSDAQHYESSELGKSERRTPWKNYSRSQKHCDGQFSHSDSRNAACNSLNSSKNRFEGKDELATLPTRIVVLKPNLGKAQNGTKSASSPCSSNAFLPDCRAHVEFPSIKNREGDSFGTKNFSDNVGLSRHNSRESREIAREITRQMRTSFCSGSMNLSSAGLRGYAGDESSCDMSGNESEANTVASRSSFDLNNRYKPSSSRSTESSVSREAKKRLSERWKMTHKSQELVVLSRGSTLAEMLAIPDKELTPANMDGMIGDDGISGKFSSDDGSTGWVEPLGISSRDGWKDGSVRKLSRSRSLPASSTAFGSPKTSMRRETLCDDRYLMPKEALKKERSKRVKGSSDWREASVPRNSKSRSKKSHSSSCTIRESNEFPADIHTNQNQVKSTLEKKDPSEEDALIFETLVGNVNDTSPVPENAVDVGCDNMTLPSKPSDEFLPNVSACIVVKDISADGQNNLIPQEPSIGQSEEGSVPLLHPSPGRESPVSSKEADQPSPVSVLEAPFTDDLSSCSECFESLNADLHGLRMQLHLLKLESEAYAEGPMLISSDEEGGEGSIGFPNEKGLGKTEESWESSYVVDVLIDSGFSDADANVDIVMATWHSPECPVDPVIFEKLEKKYSSQTSCLRSERRLLFDRINSSLLEIYQQFMDPNAWVRPATRVGSKDGLQDRLFVLLGSQEKKSNKDTLGKVLARESQWLDLGDGIDVIGREIERLLIDELVAEVVAM